LDCSLCSLVALGHCTVVNRVVRVEQQKLRSLLAPRNCGLRPPSVHCTMKTILFIGVDEHLFKVCFGQDDKWACQFKSLSEDCGVDEETLALQQPNLQAVIIEDDETPYWNAIQQFYHRGGFVVYFGILGEFAAVTRIGQQLGLRWRFSAYTSHKYVLTPVAMHYLGGAVKEQEYTKANLVSAPVVDRLVVPKVPSIEDFIEDNVGCSGYTEEQKDDEYEEEVAEARARYPQYCEEQMHQSPLVLHRNEEGGRFVYVRFVNGDHNIPDIVRALLTGSHTEV